MNIENRLPTVSEFISLRAQTNWGVPTPEIARTVLKRSLSGIVALDDNQIIGMARTVGDGHLILYIQDVVVDANYRSKGIGRALIEKLLKKLQSKCSPDCTIGLFAAIGQSGFYEGLGFSKRGNTAYGPGMHGTLSDLAKPRGAA